MRVVITGPNGYIARNLFSRLYENRVDASFLSLRGDAWRSVRFSDYDRIVHLAGAVHNSAGGADEIFKINAELTAGLALKAKNDGVPRFIFVSTMAVYGADSAFCPLNEITPQTPLSPKTPYGESKLTGERAVEEIYGGDACIVRPPMVYGENCTGNYRLLRALALRLRLVPRVENRRSMIYVHNLCEFLRLLLINGDTGVFHPQDELTVNTTKLAIEIGRLNGVKTHGIKVPFLSTAAKLIPPLKKAFGSLSYAPEMSEYGGGDYRLYDAEQAFERTERLWR